MTQTIRKSRWLFRIFYDYNFVKRLLLEQTII